MIPTFMRTQPAVNLNEVVANRTFRIERSNGGWAINGNFFDVNRVDAHVKRNTAEIWTLQNNSGSWSHPVHIHFEEFRILNRNEAAPPANELGRKDVIKLGRKSLSRSLCASATGPAVTHALPQHWCMRTTQ